MEIRIPAASVPVLDQADVIVYGRGGVDASVIAGPASNLIASAPLLEFEIYRLLDRNARQIFLYIALVIGTRLPESAVESRAIMRRCGDLE